MNINGKNGLACLTDIDSLTQPIVLRPLPGLPVIRDLIVDMTQFFKQYHSIKPYLINDETAARAGTAAVAGRARRAQWSLRVHPVRLLFDLMPVVLVESRQVRRPGRTAQRLPFPCRHARSGDQRTAGRPRRSLSLVPLPFDHELRRRLPEEPQSDAGDRQDQGHDGAAGGMTISRGRVRWHCRRALLELDLVLARFLENDFDQLSDAELLDLRDLLFWRTTTFGPMVNGRQGCPESRWTSLIETMGRPGACSSSSSQYANISNG